MLNRLVLFLKNVSKGLLLLLFKCLPLLEQSYMLSLQQASGECKAGFFFFRDSCFVWCADAYSWYLLSCLTGVFTESLFKDNLADFLLTNENYGVLFIVCSGSHSATQCRIHYIWQHPSPAHRIYRKFLPSSSRLRQPLAKTNRYKFAFVASATSPLNSAHLQLRLFFLLHVFTFYSWM